MTSEINLQGNREQREEVGNQGASSKYHNRLAGLELKMRFPGVSAVPDLFTVLPDELSHIVDIAC